MLMPLSRLLNRATGWTLLTLVGLLLLCFAALYVGPADLAAVANPSAVIELRWWRSLAAALAGGALAAAGVLLQGLFRNPLASPSVTGCVSGATLGGVVALLLQAGLVGVGVLPAWLPHEVILPLGCLVGALGSLGVLLLLVGRTADLVIILLVGFVLAAGLGAVTAFLIAMAHYQWDLGRALVAFAQGGVAHAGVRHVLMGVPLVLGGVLAAWRWAPELDMLLTGEAEAEALGVDVAAVRWWVLIWSGILVAAATAVAGPVGFIGLVVPHAMRQLVGPGHRGLLPAAVFGGAALAVGCDMIARLAPLGSEPGLGVVTALFGAPVFAWMVLSSRRQGRL